MEEWRYNPTHFNVGSVWRGEWSALLRGKRASGTHWVGGYGPQSMSGREKSLPLMGLTFIENKYRF